VAVAAPLIWIGLSGEFSAAKGGAVNLGIAAAGMSVYLFLLYGDDQETQNLVTAINSAIFAFKPGCRF
jgi:hypothetical protein